MLNLKNKNAYLTKIKLNKKINTKSELEWI